MARQRLMIVGIALACIGVIGILVYVIFSTSAPTAITSSETVVTTYERSSATTNPHDVADNTAPESGHNTEVTVTPEDNSPDTKPLVPAEESDRDGIKPANCAVAGIVRTPEGEPAKNIQLSLVLKRQEHWIEVARAWTEPDGRYGIGSTSLLKQVKELSSDSRGYTPIGLQAGHYRIEARSDHYFYTAKEFRLDNGLEVQSLQMRPNSRVDITVDVTNLDGTQALQLYATYSAYDAGAGFIVESRFDDPSTKTTDTRTSFRAGEQRRSRLATPDPSIPGRFTFEAHALEKVVLDFMQTNYTLTSPSKDELTLNLSDGMPRTLQLTFERGRPPLNPLEVGTSTISGQLSSDIPEINLAATRLEAQHGESKWNGVVKPDGSFQVRNLPDGDYTLTFQNAKFTADIEHKVSLFREAYVNLFVQGTPLSFKLHPNGADLVGAVIQVGTKTRPRIFYQAITNEYLTEGGTYTPDHIRWTPGEYVAEIVAAGATLGDAAPDGRKFFSVHPGSAAITVDLKVAASTQAKIQVVDADGYGWAGGECRLLTEEHFKTVKEARNFGRPINWSGSQLIALDNLGKASVDRITDGKYMLLVWVRSWDPKQWDHAETLTLKDSKTHLIRVSFDNE